MDNFSAWVIYVAIIALAVDPRLWQRFGGGDECLLFRRKDFEHPDGSDALHTLQTFPDERIRSLGNVFRSLLYIEPQQTPPLDGQQLRPPAHIVITCGSCGQALRVPTDRGRGQFSCPTCGWKKDWAPSPSNVPEWVRDHIGHDSIQTGEPALDERDNDTQPIPEPDPTWILDFLGPTDKSIQAMSFARSVAAERVIIGISIIGTVLLILATQAGVVSTITMGLVFPLAALLNVGLWLYRYSLEPAVADFARLKSQLRAINDKITTTMANINSADRAKAKHRNKEVADQARLVKEQQSLEAKQTKEIAGHQKELQSALSSINTRRQTMNQQEADALRKVQRNVGAKVAALTQEIGQLRQSEATELATALKTQQEQYIIAYLRSFMVETASIPGMGPSFKSRLKSAGFHSAADIDVYQVQRVKGIGMSRASSLLTWRRSIESRAQASMPQALSHSDTTSIQAKYQSRRRSLEEEKTRAEQQQRHEEDAIRARHHQSKRQLDSEESIAKTTAKREIEAIRARYAPQYDSFGKALSKLADETVSTLSQIDSGINEARKRLFSLYWEKEKESRRLRTFDGVHFLNYLKRVFVGSRATWRRKSVALP